MNGPEMAFRVQRRGAALSSVSMLNGLLVGGRFVCSAFIEGLYLLIRERALAVFFPPKTPAGLQSFQNCPVALTLLFTLHPSPPRGEGGAVHRGLRSSFHRCLFTVE